MVALGLDAYTWIVVLSGFFAFFAACGIGSNDMANSFATTVGSKALTIGQVVVVAAFCEFGGAVLLGAGVTATIKGGVVRLASFTNSPALILFGFMCVLIAAAFWDNFATHIGLPVSTTHTTVGAVVGMTIALRGFNAVIWNQPKDEFPYVSGMVPIFLSWIVSPILSGGFTTIIFIVTRTLILRRQNSLRNAMIGLPILVGGTFWLVVSFIIQTGSKNKTWPNRGDNFAIWVGAVCGAGMCLIFLAVVMPLLKRKVLAEHAAMEAAAVDAEAGGNGEGKEGVEVLEKQTVPEKQTWFTRNVTSKIPASIRESAFSSVVTKGINHDIHKEGADNPRVQAMAENAEKFDPRTESLFRYLQVFSAMSMSFAHGANDVANAMGPFSAVYSIYTEGVLSNNTSVQTWILALGGFGIVVGLSTFGYKILRVLGVDAVKISNSRGFSAELGTAITVVLASRLGLPVSTTQCICGALFAIGLIEGAKGVNWRVFAKIICGWVLTLIVAAFVAAAFVSFGAYAPSKQQTDAIFTASKALNGTNTAMLKQLFAANGAVPNALTTTLNTLNSTFYKAFKPKVRDISQLVSASGLILKQFNTTFAV